MPKFEITYTDPKTGERKSRIENFEDTPSIPAREWAEDASYSWADKNMDYFIKELRK